MQRSTDAANRKNRKKRLDFGAREEMQATKILP